MQIPIELTFRNTSPSLALEATVREWVSRLVQVLPLQRCHVVVEMPHAHHQHGSEFQVHITLSIPGHTVSITRGARPEYRDPYRALADAFRAARRGLLDFVAQRRDARPAL